MDNDFGPHHWLENLSQSIMASLCKKENHPVELNEGLRAAMKLMDETIRNTASIFWVGNGGSSAMCSHLAQDAMNKLGAKSLYLGDTALMTCMANDFGYENVYVRPLQVMAGPGDLLIAISSSGNSANILNSANLAIEKKMNLITLSGFKEDNRLWNHPSSLSFFIRSDLYGIVELGHEALLHAVIESLWLEKKHGGRQPG